MLSFILLMERQGRVCIFLHSGLLTFHFLCIDVSWICVNVYSSRATSHCVFVDEKGVWSLVGLYDGAGI